MHPIWILAFFTIIGTAAFAAYALTSHRRLEKYDGKASGIGGPNDPMAGARPLDRSPREMTESLRVKKR